MELYVSTKVSLHRWGVKTLGDSPTLSNISKRNLLTYCKCLSSENPEICLMNYRIVFIFSNLASKFFYTVSNAILL